jgi:hypothetical protein
MIKKKNKKNNTKTYMLSINLDFETFFSIYIFLLLIDIRFKYIIVVYFCFPFLYTSIRDIIISFILYFK